MLKYDFLFSFEFTGLHPSIEWQADCSRRSHSNKGWAEWESIFSISLAKADIDAVLLIHQHCTEKNSRCRSEMNILSAWQRGYTGKNVVVTILDDGIERNHPDLAQNYVSLPTLWPSLVWLYTIRSMWNKPISLCFPVKLGVIGHNLSVNKFHFSAWHPVLERVMAAVGCNLSHLVIEQKRLEGRDVKE